MSSSEQPAAGRIAGSAGGSGGVGSCAGGFHRGPGPNQGEGAHGAPDADSPPAPVPGCVAAVIVHHATPDLLRRCLEALAAHGAGWLGSTVVVDNASPGSVPAPLAAAFPQVRFVRAERNLGFAAGANLGWRAQPAPFHLLLNPDAWLQAGALDAMLACMTAAPQAAVVAPRLENPDGTLQYSCRRFPTLAAVLLRGLRLDGLWPQPVDRYLMRDWDHGQRRPIDWAIGACLLLRQQAVQAVGGFDESFFLYYEDADLCRRLQQAGWQVWYEPGARVRHLHRRASATLWPGRPARAHARSLVRLFRKHSFPLW